LRFIKLNAVSLAFTVGALLFMVVALAAAEVAIFRVALDQVRELVGQTRMLAARKIAGLSVAFKSRGLAMRHERSSRKDGSQILEGSRRETR
jgi:hypothetical protein